MGSWWVCSDISLYSDWDCGVSCANLRQPMALRMDRMRKEQREERNRHGGLGCPTNRQLNNGFQISLDWCDGIICVNRNSICSFVSIGIRWLMSICLLWSILCQVSCLLFFVMFTNNQVPYPRLSRVPPRFWGRDQDRRRRDRSRSRDRHKDAWGFR